VAAAVAAVAAKAAVSLSEALIVAKVAQNGGGNVPNVVVAAFLGAFYNGRKGGRAATVEGVCRIPRFVRETLLILRILSDGEALSRKPP
jgi:hypothetical protein